MEIVRTTPFVTAIKKLGARVGELDALDRQLVSNPAAGDVIQGLRGVRKIRFAMKGKGKSGGGRCVYLSIVLDDAIYLITVCD